MNPRIAMVGAVGAIVLFACACWIEVGRQRGEARYERMVAPFIPKR